VSSVGPRLRVAFIACAVAVAACQGPDPFFRYRGDAGADLGGAGTYPPTAGTSGFAGAAAGFAGAGAAGATGAAGAAIGAAGAIGGAGAGAAGAGDAGATGAAGAAMPCTTCMVKVQYTCRADDSDGAQASFVLDVTNESSTTFPLTSLTLRYWYTVDVGKDQELDCDYAKLGCTNLVTSADTSPAPKFVAVMPPRMYATEYAEIAFKAGALSLDPFLDTGELQLRLHNKDFSPFKQADDDYSYNCSMKGNPIDWPKITAYLDGVLVWGTEPE